MDSSLTHPAAARDLPDADAGRASATDATTATAPSKTPAPDATVTGTATMVPPVHAPDFLARHGRAGAVITPLAGDASFRRYFRVSHGAERAVLMDAPAPHEDPRPFLEVAAYLAAHGLRPPRVLAADHAAGLVLLEDFGDRLMRGVVDAEPAREVGIYGQAIDVLAALHRAPAADVAPYDLATYLREAALLTTWYAPAVGVTVDADGFERAWRQVLAPVIAAPEPGVTVLRDYHAENLMLLDDGAMGLLDFQDALVGHPAYDLVSLLKDARRDVDPALEAAMRARYAAATGRGGDAFDAAYAILGAQRNTKIIGIFTRLARRDGKARYLDLLPRMWGLLERDLAHPALAPVAAWYADHLPPAARVTPGANR